MTTDDLQPTTPMTTTDLQPKPPHQRSWSVGTLTYNRGQLANVFFWLLWGDFCLTLMDNGVASQIVNLQLKKLGASNAAIGFLNGTVMAIMSALLVSVISTSSDRTRTRLGRRMPYLLWATPPLAVFLILLGFSKQLAEGLQDVSPWIASKLAWSAGNLLPGVGTLPHQAALIIGMMTLLLILYKLCDLFPQSIYYYVWADVVPAKLMGTFACLFRVVAAIGLFIFERFILGWADTHPEHIYVGAGLLYLFSFIAMSLIVKEGKYPPPPERPVHAKSGLIAAFERAWKGVDAYLRECFTHSYYWKYYLMSGCFIIAVKSLQQFMLFFGTTGLGLSTQRYGEIVSWRNVVTIVPFLIMGPLVDKYHPLRAGLLAYVLVLIAGVLSFFFIQGETSFAIFITATFVSIAIYQAATGAIGPRLLPREQYGQFSSANAVVWQLGWAVSSLVCGWFLDVVTKLDPATGKPQAPENYRFLFLWFSIFCVAGLLLTISVYRHWKKLGGDDAYEPPRTITTTLGAT